MKRWKNCRALLAALLCAVYLAGCAGEERGAPQGSGAVQNSGSVQDSVPPADDSPGSQNTASSAGGITEAPDGEKKRELFCQRVQVMEVSFSAGLFYEPDENYGEYLGVQFYQGEPAMIWGYSGSGARQFRFREDNRPRRNWIMQCL